MRWGVELLCGLRPVLRLGSLADPVADLAELVGGEVALLLPATGLDPLLVVLLGLLELSLALQCVGQVEEGPLVVGVLLEVVPEQLLVPLELVLLASSVAQVLDERYLPGDVADGSAPARPVLVSDPLARPGLAHAHEPDVPVLGSAVNLQQRAAGVGALPQVLSQPGGVRAHQLHVGVQHQSPLALCQAFSGLEGERAVVPEVQPLVLGDLAAQRPRLVGGAVAGPCVYHHHIVHGVPGRDYAPLQDALLLSDHEQQTDHGRSFC